MSKSFREKLLSLPKIDEYNKIYDSLWIVPTGKKHDSGYMKIALIGTIDREPKEIITDKCDDFGLNFPEQRRLGLRMESDYPSGINHFWSLYYNFKIETNSSTVEVSLIKKEINEKK